MHTQENIKLLAAIVATGCITFGILALFRGLRADGKVNISALFKGTLETGSAGVLLLFFGVALFAIVIIKGHQSESLDQLRRKPTASAVSNARPALPGAATSASPFDSGAEVFETHLKMENAAYNKKKKPWWQFW